MSNRTIAIIFMVISAVLLTLSAYARFPVMCFYGIITMFLSAAIYHQENEHR